MQEHKNTREFHHLEIAGFLRGAAALMAHDLSSTQTSGWQVQMSGDAHPSNFGAFATPEVTVREGPGLNAAAVELVGTLGAGLLLLSGVRLLTRRRVAA